MTDTAVLTLAEFLLARIAEDEAVAREATETAVRNYGGVPRYSGEYAALDDDDRWLVVGPARVLRECAAKRALVKLHGAPHDLCLRFDAWGEPTNQTRPTTCAVLRFLAQPYADHPDYRDEWRP